MHLGLNFIILKLSLNAWVGTGDCEEALALRKEVKLYEKSDFDKNLLLL